MCAVHPFVPPLPTPVPFSLFLFLQGSFGAFHCGRTVAVLGEEGNGPDLSTLSAPIRVPSKTCSAALEGNHPARCAASAKGLGSNDTLCQCNRLLTFIRNPRERLFADRIKRTWRR